MCDAAYILRAEEACMRCCLSSGELEKGHNILNEVSDICASV
jgi:hypothetical protein